MGVHQSRVNWHRLLLGTAIVGGAFFVAACGASNTVDTSGAYANPPTPDITPDACTLLSAQEVSQAIGAQPTTPEYNTRSITVSSTTAPIKVGQCVYSSNTYTASPSSGSSIIVTVFPSTPLSALAALTSGATQVSAVEVVQESDTAGIIAVQEGSASVPTVVEIALDRVDVSSAQRTQLLETLANTLPPISLSTTPS